MPITRIRCETLFDITATGVRSVSRNRVPFVDDTGRTIKTELDWNRARNQQRNWETLNQIIALRTLPTNISQPQRQATEDLVRWCFEFDMEQTQGLEIDGDSLGALKKDCEDVPMLVQLGEIPGIDPKLQIDRNVWFRTIADK